MNIINNSDPQLPGPAAALPAKPVLDTVTEHAARAFMRRLEGKYPAIAGLLFGSRARGDHRADSDADIAVILQGERGDRFAAVIDMAGIAVDVLQETGILVQALPLWESELKRPELFSNPSMIEKIKREGLRLRAKRYCRKHMSCPG